MIENYFHDWKLIEHCGGGAYGDVYYCEDISGKKLALKIISKKRLGDSWERELQGVKDYQKITGKAPQLLQIFHVGEDEENFFYTMEPADPVNSEKYIPDTLAYRLQSGPLPGKDIFPVLNEIFYAIKSLHDNGFAHRDIKPDNILFVKGIPKLADIGLLSNLENSMTMLAGTLDFIPPEERLQDSHSSSNRSSRLHNDLYAFGKVIYCAITGMGAQEFPSVPGELQHTPQLKYFSHLAWQMCNRIPEKRIDSIGELAREFADIERKLIYGENFSDRLSYAGKNMRLLITGFFISSWRLIKCYWHLMLLLVLIGGSAAYWIWKPETPIDITEIENKEFRSRYLDLTMTIPAQWEIITKETIEKKIAEIKPENEQEKKLFLLFSKLVEAGADFIICDFESDFKSNVTIQAFPIPPKEIFDLGDDEIRMEIKNIFQGDLGFNTEIYEIKRITVAGSPCIFIDLSHDPDKFRTNNYIFPLGDQCFSVALISDIKTFDKNKKEFEAALKTLKIGK